MTPQQLEKRTKQLATQVNLAPGRLPDVADDLAQVVATADAQVARHLGTAQAQVPAPGRERAVLAGGAELWAGRSAVGGVLAAFSDMGGTPVRLARDPMVAAAALLRPWTGHGVGIA